MAQNAKKFSNKQVEAFSAARGRESRGKVWPTALLARCSGLHNMHTVKKRPCLFRRRQLFCLESDVA